MEALIILPSILLEIVSSLSQPNFKETASKHPVCLKLFQCIEFTFSSESETADVFGDGIWETAAKIFTNLLAFNWAHLIQPFISE